MNVLVHFVAIFCIVPLMATAECKGCCCWKGVIFSYHPLSAVGIGIGKSAVFRDALKATHALREHCHKVKSLLSDSNIVTEDKID